MRRAEKPTIGRGLSAWERYQVFASVLTGPMSPSDAARKWGLDHAEVARICQVAAEAALNALTSHRPAQ